MSHSISSDPPYYKLACEMKFYVNMFTPVMVHWILDAWYRVYLLYCPPSELIHRTTRGSTLDTEEPGVWSYLKVNSKSMMSLIKDVRIASRQKQTH